MDIGYEVSFVNKCVVIKYDKKFFYGAPKYFISLYLKSAMICYIIMN